MSTRHIRPAAPDLEGSGAVVWVILAMVFLAGVFTGALTLWGAMR